MQISELINQINSSTEEMDFSSARKYIEDNLDELENHKHRLNSNAREIYNFITEMLHNGYQPLSKKDLAKINTINSYANQFNIRGLKMQVKDSTELFMRKDISNYLNKDAKVLLESWGVLN